MAPQDDNPDSRRVGADNPSVCFADSSPYTGEPRGTCGSCQRRTPCLPCVRGGVARMRDGEVVFPLKKPKNPAPVPWFGTRAGFSSFSASWCHPNSTGFLTKPVLLTLHGAGGRRGRLRPRSAAVFRPSSPWRGFQPLTPFSGRGCWDVLMRLLCGCSAFPFAYS